MAHDLAFWFNARAKRVTPAVVEAFREAAPKARLWATDSLEAARTAAEEIVRDPPPLLLCGGGDGTVVVLLNLLRELGLKQFPTLGLLQLGTGNGWPRAVHAPPWKQTLKRLGKLPLAAPTQRFDLIEVENKLCHFTGVGWDAIILHDYKRNLDKRRADPLAAKWSVKLHTSVFGYLYSVARLTVPEQMKNAPATVKLENLGEPAFTVGEGGSPVSVAGETKLLHEGRLSVAAAGTEPYWGMGFKAFPYAMAMPGRINVRFYDRPVLEGFLNMPRLWTGGIGMRGFTDFFVTKARFVFSREVPFQIGGDVVGPRLALEIGVAKESVQIVRWDLL